MSNATEQVESIKKAINTAISVMMSTHYTPDQFKDVSESIQFLHQFLEDMTINKDMTINED